MPKLGLPGYVCNSFALACTSSSPSMRRRMLAEELFQAMDISISRGKKYCVRPNTGVGVVQSHSSVEVTVTMQAQREAPPDMECKDKFLVQIVITPSSKDVS